jgi:hypothetical protein
MLTDAALMLTDADCDAGMLMLQCVDAWNGKQTTEQTRGKNRSEQDRGG